VKEKDMRFTVKRSGWYRGHGAQGSRLLRHDGQRCCLGFVGQQCGLPDAELIERETLFAAAYQSQYAESLINAGVWERRGMSNYTRDRDFVSQAYGVNDDPETSDAERESRRRATY
jgi:hypothetical protein